MKSTNVWRVAAIGGLVLATSASSLAQAPTQLNGLISDYTAATTVAPSGPWDVRGPWSLQLMGASGKASFSATLAMLRSDLWVISTAGDPDNPTARTFHTHHVTLVDGDVTPIANGFRVSGTATVTASGNPAPFGALSHLEVDVTGGSSVQFSNIKLTFGSPASGHFGAAPLDGVVVNAH